MAINGLKEEDKLAGNAQDSLDKSESAANNLFNSRGNATSGDLSSLESDLDNKYSQDFQALDKSGGAEQSAQQELQDKETASDSLFKPGTQLESKKNALQRLWARNGVKPSAGIGAALTFAGALILTMAGGSSFWVALEKNVTSENTNDARTNLVMRRAFNNMIAHSSGCGAIKLVCKMKTATKEQIRKWKDGFFTTKGTITDENGKPKGGGSEVIDPDKLKEGDRVAIDEVTAKDGTVLKSGADLNGYTDANIKGRSWFTRGFNLRTSDFVNGKINKLIGKFGVNKAKASAEEKKTDNATKDSAKAAVEKAKGPYDPVKNPGMAALKSMQGIAGTAAFAGQLGCMLYNTTRISIGTVKAAWVLDIIRFMWPFMRLISKVADGSATEADMQEIEQRFSQLTDYLPPTKASEMKDKVDAGTLTDEDKDLLGSYGIDVDDDRLTGEKDAVKTDIDEVTNKNAFDSQGLRMIMSGDNTDLSAFTKQFTTAAIGSAVVTASDWINTIQGIAGAGNLKDGKRNIRTACIAINTAANGAAGANIVRCVAEATVPGVGWAAALADCGKDAVVGAAKYITLWVLLQKSLDLIIPYMLATVPVRLDLRGPAAGDVISAALGLFLTRKSASSGLGPALSMGAVTGFLTSTNKVYNQYNDELAAYDARSTPFDATNRFSFMGQVLSSLNPYPAAPDRQTGFSYLANLFGVISKNANPIASALHSQPVLLTESQQNLVHRTSNGNCTDFEKYEEGMICDWNGQAIMVSSPRVLQWAKEDADGKADHLTEVIKWMQKVQPNDEGQAASSGTNDETCSELSNLANGEFNTVGKCDDSNQLASIDEEGKPIPKSQYENYVKYCTGDRELEPGSTDITTDNGSEKEQAWHSAKQCGKQNSYMMDAFSYYYNMCYVQYSVANGATDCTNDAPPVSGGGSSDSSAGSCGDGSTASIYDCALQFDQYGYGLTQPHDQYGKVSWYQSFKTSPPAPEDLKLDCSALVMAAIVAAFGQDISNQVASGTFTSDKTLWQSVPKDQAKRGDVVVMPDHVEIIKDNDPGSQHFTTFGAHTAGVDYDKQIGPSGYDYSGVGVGTFRYIGPGVGTGSGNINV